jgi:hypothetical protein
MNTRFYVSHKNVVINIIVYELFGFHSVVAEYTQVLSWGIPVVCVT